MKKKVIKEMYALIVEACDLESQKPTALEVAKNKRGILPYYRRTVSAIKNAQRYVAKAMDILPGARYQGFAPWLSLLEEGRNKLTEAEGMVLQFQGIQASSIHPQLRRPHEFSGAKYENLLPGHGYDLNSFGSVAVEYWLIWKLDQLLIGYTPIAAHRHRVISQVFAHGLNDVSWQASRIKRALFLLGENRQSKSP